MNRAFKSSNFVSKVIREGECLCVFLPMCFSPDLPVSICTQTSVVHFMEIRKNSNQAGCLVSIGYTGVRHSAHCPEFILLELDATSTAHCFAMRSAKPCARVQAFGNNEFQSVVVLKKP